MRNLLLILFLLISQIGYTAESLPEKIMNVQKKIHRDKGEFYTIKDDWTKEEKLLEQEFIKLTYSLEILRNKTDILKQKKNILNDEIILMQQNIKKSNNLELKLDDLLIDALSQLESFIHYYPPFLMEERIGRIKTLNKFVLSKDNKPSEKVRKVIEAHKIEADFSRFADITDVQIAVDNNTMSGQLFRIGNLAQFFITPDQQFIATYNPVIHKFVGIDMKFKGEIIKAAELLNGKRLPELSMLPIGKVASQ